MTLTASELGRRFAEARQRGGHSQEAVAAVLGISRSAVSLIESGDRQLTGLELLRFARFLGVQINDILDGNDPRREMGALFRTVLAKGVDQGTASELVESLAPACGVIEDLDEVLAQGAARPKLPKYEAPLAQYGATEQGRAIAKRERERLGLGFRPVPDLGVLLMEQGMVVAEHVLPEGVSGAQFQFRDRPFALVHADDSGWRRRFSLAHEYCHALVDRDAGGVIISRVDDDAPRERRANAFAGAFLLPREGVLAFSHEVGRLPREMDFVNVVDLAQRFGLSYDAALVQLKANGMLGEGEMASLRARASQADAVRKRRYGKHSTPDARVTLAQWAWLRALRAYERDLISTKKALAIAASLKVPRPRAESQLAFTQPLEADEE